MKKPIWIIIFIATAAASYYFVKSSNFDKKANSFSGLFNSIKTKKNKYDEVTNENPKIGILYDSLYDNELKRIKSNWYGGYKNDAYIRFEKLPTLIKQIETYAKYGSDSDDKFNNLELKITYNNGEVADNIYTGNRVMTAMYDPDLLLKLEFENGKVSKSYSNGAELNVSPKDIFKDLLIIVDAVRIYDQRKNPSDYLKPPKTTDDIKKEWDDINPKTIPKK